MKLKDNTSFLGAGLIFVLLCCFTPLLVVVVGLVGLGWLTGYLDYVLMPLVGLLITALTVVLSSQYKENRILYAGGIALVCFTILFGTWNVVLGALVLAGAGLALLAYLPQFKKILQRL